MATYTVWARKRPVRPIAWLCGPEWALVRDVLSAYDAVAPGQAARRGRARAGHLGRAAVRPAAGRAAGRGARRREAVRHAPGGRAGRRAAGYRVHGVRLRRGGLPPGGRGREE